MNTQSSKSAHSKTTAPPIPETILDVVEESKLSSMALLLSNTLLLDYIFMLLENNTPALRAVFDLKVLLLI